MTKAFTFLQGAEQDVEEIVDYISHDSAQAAATFRVALQHVCEMLVDIPEAGSTRTFRNPEMKGVRMLPVRKFDKYLIFYRSTSEGLEIVRVVHGARDLPSLFH
jgi:toxin ParE1/3/4